MASSASGYKPVSTIPDVIVAMKGADRGGGKDISDLAGILFTASYKRDDISYY